MLVSVIVPSYNHEAFLEQRLKSIFDQSYSKFEVIILDDKSPDNSHLIIEKYKNHPKVAHCIINDQNSGSTFTQWNKGIDLANGDLIWIAESDDVADTEFLSTLVEQFDKNQKLVLAYCQSYRMNAKGELTGDWKNQTDSMDYDLFKNDFNMSGYKYYERFLNQQNTIPNASAVVFKKKSYLQVGGAEPDLKFIGDWCLWSKICLTGDIYYCSQKMNFFRYHDSSVIHQARKKKDQIEIRRQFVNMRLSVFNFLHDKQSYYNNIISSQKTSHKMLIKELVKAQSLYVRKYKFRKIVPNAYQSLAIMPVKLKILYFIKFNIHFLISLIVYPLFYLKNKNTS